MIFLHIAMTIINIRCIDERTICFCHKFIKVAKNKKMSKKHWTSWENSSRYDVILHDTYLKGVTK